MLFTILCALVNVHAAPSPASGGLAHAKPGLYYSPRGFRLDAAQTAWVQTAPPKSIPSLVTVYQAPLKGDAGIAPALTVRVDEIESGLALKTYVKRWMQDYSRFGFEVLGAKNVTINSHEAFLLDIFSRETKKQLRQVVFVHHRTAVILNCRDDQRSFGKSVQDCNQIIKTFRWTGDPSADT